MTFARITIFLLLALAGLVVLFDVSFAPRFTLPREIERPDPVQEQRYEACFEKKDAEIHAEAFGTIDNPDVQRDFINRHREEARSECRVRYPERIITVNEPLAVNLLKLDFRWE